MYDVVVIGAGLFGNVIAAALRRLGGLNVVVVDDGKAGRGSFPAACLMKPSWLGSMRREDQEAALELLEHLYGVQQLEFRLPLGKTTNVNWVEPKKILQPPDVKGLVSHVGRADFGWEVWVHGGVGRVEKMYAQNVIAATGFWTDQLLHMAAFNKLPPMAEPPVVQGQAGVAFLFPNAQLERPFISPWAPYKQLVAFNRGDGLWIGDGSAIKSENWTAERTQQSFRRCLNALVEKVDARVLVEVETLFGIRPYVAGPQGKPSYLQEVYKDFWVATGGAKNGTAGAAWCANKLLEELA